MNKIYVFKDLKSFGNKLGLVTSTLATAFVIGVSFIGEEPEEEANKKNIKITHIDDLKNIDEKNEVDVVYSDITDTDLCMLPYETEILNLNFCYYLTNLDNLKNYCPNLRYLFINQAPSLESLDFVYEMPNLQYFYIYNSDLVDIKLVTYLKMHDIETNIDEKDLEVAKWVDQEYKKIISDDMTDEEKIKAISLYVIDNYEYDIDLESDSNLKPLECMMDNKAGVCVSYAYLTNVLLKKAGIKTHFTVDYDHAWNIIKENDKYYYLDTTNLDNDYTKALMVKAKHAPFYMSDPTSTRLSAMTDYNANEDEIVIPKSLIVDINKGQSTKTLYEKYGTDFTLYQLKYTVPIFIIFAILNGIDIYKFFEDNKKYKLNTEKRLLNKKIDELNDILKEKRF